MIRFVDIEKGIVFNGDKPYVFWMDDQQSTQLIYVKKICILSDLKYLRLTIPTNDVFHYIDVSHLEELDDVQVNDFKYKDIKDMYTNDFFSTGVNYKGLYVHMIYISAQSENIGEFHESFYINDTEYEIAADFYEQNEALKINLTNFGEEIPESIQGAIYDTNVHEESKDNITLNRKFKELLLNYWNIVAARGSYRSLLDSLSWFEYGDLVTINELWKHNEWGLDRMNREDLNIIMTERIRNSLANFSKTTYIGLYTALQKYVTQDGEVQYDKLNNVVVEETVIDTDILSAQTDRLIPNNPVDKDWLFTIRENDITIDEYDDREEDEIVGPGSNWLRNNRTDYKGFIGEEVPLLKSKIFKWSVEDISLKMYLLGSFYEAYFMPIHLDLIHSTVESLVFTNTIKCMNITDMDRFDYVLNTEAFHCNIPDGATYKMQDVNVQAGSMLRRHWSDNSNNYYETPMVNTFKLNTTDNSSDDSSDYQSLYDTIPIFGVEEEYNHPMKLDGESSEDVIVNDRLKTFMLNNYNGIGVVIPFHCEIPAEEGDFINCEKMIIFTKDGLKDRVLEKHVLYPAIKVDDEDSDDNNDTYKFYVDFNLLLTDEGENTVTLYFSTAGGRQYIKSLHITLLGDVSCRLKMYRVKSSNLLQGLNAEDYNLDNIGEYDDEFRENYIRPFNNYIFSHTRYEQSLRDQTSKSLSEQGYTSVPGYSKLFIAGTEVNTNTDNGVKYNHVIIFDADFLNEASNEEVATITSSIDLFNVGYRETPNGKKYYTLVSKSFKGDDDIDQSINDIVNTLRCTSEGKNYILRYSLGFFFQHHYLEALGVGKEESTGKYKYGLSLDDYTVTDKDTLCVVPEMKYSNVQLTDTEWIFKNIATNEKVEFTSTKEPFIGNDVKEKLKPGYYDVTFKYKVGATWGETTLNSAFRKV